MQKVVMAVAVTAVLGMLPVSPAAATDTQQDKHHHHHRTHVRADDAPYADPDPRVRGEYMMNGGFDWRRRGAKVPWYAHGYNDDCVAWEQNAYHYACDPNNRY